ncbi:hypothetical protein LIA77_03378 [Sarocladium implicatum]|nr:hypothetical protein LIA77_03378 [Sarocladium implicatum]
MLASCLLDRSHQGTNKVSETGRTRLYSAQRKGVWICSTPGPAVQMQLRTAEKCHKAVAVIVMSVYFRLALSVRTLCRTRLAERMGSRLVQGKRRELGCGWLGGACTPECQTTTGRDRSKNKR